MRRRLLLPLIAVLLGAQSFVAAAQEQSLPKGMPGVATVYVARGAADACGRGCDRWIAIEGKLDKGAAARLRKVLSAQKANLPIYLYSPGGEVREGFAMGRMLRTRKAVARVGRTIVRECGADAQAEPQCLKLKQAGGELEAELIENAAFCNSACAYLMLGATVRQIAPVVGVGVHTARVTLSYRGRTPPKAIRERASRQAIDRLDRDLAAYLAEMGIDGGLLDLIKTVKFEKMHRLKRDELVRFGIDRREVVETTWRVTDRGPGSHADKIMLARDGQRGFRTLRWRLACSGAPQLVLYYQRSNGDEALASAVIRFGADQKLVMNLNGWPGPIELRSARVEAGQLQQLRMAAEISLMELGEAGEATERPARETVVSTDGLPRAIEQLLPVCGRT